MKKSDVERIVGENIEEIKMRLGLDNWRILIEYGPALLDGDDTHYSGLCSTTPDLFETAIVTLDPKHFDSSAEVLDTLAHELCHCIASNFDVCQAVLKRLLPKREYAAVGVLFHIAHEKVVASVQKILASHPSE